MEIDIILSLYLVFIFILIIFVSYLFISDFKIIIDNEKKTENIS